MTYSLLTEKETVARKPYNCIWCGQDIAAGERYWREKSVYDGHMQSFPWHPECKRGSGAHFTYEEEFQPYENERPDYRLPAGVRP